MTKKQIIVTILIIILLLLGVSMLNGVAKKTENKQIMTYIVYSDETKELIENLIKKHDPKAFTDEGSIKSYEIDPETISENPMGGIMFIIYINDNKNSDIGITLGNNKDGDLVIKSYDLSPTLFDIWGLDQND
jgi:hypothetical protein